MSTFGLNGLNALAKLKGSAETWPDRFARSTECLGAESGAQWCKLMADSTENIPAYHDIIIFMRRTYLCLLWDGQVPRGLGMSERHRCRNYRGKAAGSRGERNPSEKIKTERTFVVPYARNKLECVE